MELSDLKRSVEAGAAGRSLIVMVCPFGYFLADQYISAIAASERLEVVPVESISAVGSRASAFSEKALFVLTLDEFKGGVSSPEFAEGIVVRCKKASSEARRDLSAYIADMPDIDAWQKSDYAAGSLPGLSGAEAKELCELCHWDIWKIQTEISKLKAFSPTTQKAMFGILKSEGAYQDAPASSADEAAKAALEGDYAKIGGGLSGLAFSAALKRRIRRIAADPPKGISERGLAEAYAAAASMDRRLKSGDIPFDMIPEYLICRIAALREASLSEKAAA